MRGSIELGLERIGRPGWDHPAKIRPRIAAASQLLLVLWLAAPTADAQPAGSGTARTERVHIDQVVVGADQQDTVALTLRVLTRDGEPVEDLRAVDLRVWQSDAPIAQADFSLEPLAGSQLAVATVMAIDASRRSVGRFFEHEIEAALDLVERAGPGEDVAILSFSDQVRVVVPFATPPRDARQRLEELGVQAMSDSGVLFDGAFEAIELVRRQLAGAGRGFVIVSSSGVDAGSSRGRERVLAASLGAEGAPAIPVFAIAQKGAVPEAVAQLRELAEGSGGSLMFSDSSGFGAQMGTIWRQMLRGYVLRFPADFDGRRHQIDVEIEGQVAGVKVAYPAASSSAPVWPYLAVAAVALLVLGGAAFVWMRQQQQPEQQPGRLLVLTGAQAGNVIRLPEGRYRVGSLAENDVVLESPGVSRHHAEIVVEATQVQIHDLKSKNGTRVNGVVRASSPLLPGDRIQFADVRAIYERGKPSKSRKPSAS